ncbi:MAG TPA: Maf family nucleotide pyrophosphatase [Castellaniella sp.]|uniref:Maf family nucleotide pyrophosphatase n=1 Tax=Castellaniella sp. TaxID=1955812 RepID=UPI002F112D78
MQLILASSSPYRRELLQRLALPFESITPDIDETPHAGERPAALSVRLAREKAARIARMHPEALIVGSDQVADFNGQPVGKPGGFEAAHAQLQRFSGRTVLFHTALCLTQGARSEAALVSTECRFLTLSEAQIDHYLSAEQPFDVAGSAKAECLGIALMESIRSDDPTALIGLPLIALCRLLRGFGADPLRPAPPV